MVKILSRLRAPAPQERLQLLEETPRINDSRSAALEISGRRRIISREGYPTSIFEISTPRSVCREALPSVRTHFRRAGAVSSVSRTIYYFLPLISSSVIVICLLPFRRSETGILLKVVCRRLVSSRFSSGEQQAAIFREGGGIDSRPSLKRICPRSFPFGRYRRILLSSRSLEIHVSR